jgi:hypothetical protein
MKTPDFKNYLNKSRQDFVKVASKYSVDEHLELRTAIDSLLIAYDQANTQIDNLQEDIRHRDELIKELRGVSECDHFADMWIKADDGEIYCRCGHKV